MSKSASFPFPTRVAKFTKSGPLGLALLCDEETNVVYIADKAPHLPAGQCQQLHNDDRFVSVNGTSALQLSLDELQELFATIPDDTIVECVVANKDSVTDAQIHAVIEEEAKVSTILPSVTGEHKDKTVTEVLEKLDVSDPLHKTVKSAIYDLTVPLTTRPPRPGEVDGVDYHFVQKEDFQRWIREGKMLEHGERNGVLYGTLKLDAKVAKLSARKISRSSMHSSPAPQASTLPIDSNADATVGHLLGESAPEQFANMTVNKFLQTIGAADPIHGALRKRVQSLVYDMTVPYTTRPRRENEKEGREYHFVSKETFAVLTKNNHFIEVGSKNSVYYGTPRLTAGVALGKQMSRQAQKRANDGVSAEATVAQILKEGAQGIPSNVPASRFLASADYANPELANIRNQIKLAIYDMTVPLTTRAPRPGEQNGREYNFVSREQFLNYIELDMMLEYGEKNGIYYGTLKLTKEEMEKSKPAMRRANMIGALDSPVQEKSNASAQASQVTLQEEDATWSETMV